MLIPAVALQKNVVGRHVASGSAVTPAPWGGYMMVSLPFVLGKDRSIVLGVECSSIRKICEIDSIHVW
jgi:hypothetical protein